MAGMGLWKIRRWSRHQSCGFRFRLFPFPIVRPPTGKRDAVSKFLPRKVAAKITQRSFGHKEEVVSPKGQVP